MNVISTMEDVNTIVTMFQAVFSAAVEMDIVYETTQKHAKVRRIKTILNGLGCMMGYLQLNYEYS